MLLSLIAPCFNEELYIGDFLASIDSQTIFKNYTNDIELIIVDGSSTDRSLEYIKSTNLNNIPNFRLVKNSNHSTPSSLNTGINNSSGKYLIRLDIHANYPKDYCELLLDFIVGSDDKCGNVGFPIRTLSKNKDLKSLAIATALSSKLGVGNSIFRTIRSFSSPIIVDTVPFGCFKREILDEIGLFDEFFHRNQDDELNLRIKKHGYQIYLLPTREVSYYCRQDFQSLFSQYYQFGYYKPFIGLKHGRAANLRQFFPPLLTFCLITLIFTSLMSFLAMLMLTLLLFLYLLFAIFIFLNLRKSSKTNPFIVVFLIQALLTLHFSYGLGYLRGSFVSMCKRLF